MEPALVLGPSARALGSTLAHRLGLTPVAARVERFPDGEADVSVPGTVAGREVLIVQSLVADPDRRLVELLLLADACRREGARRCIAVVPYFGYARQDRRSGKGEPLGAQRVCRMLEAAPIDHLVTVDLHSHAVETALELPLTHASAVPLLAEALRPTLPPDAVLVSPDLGAAKLAQGYAELLERPMAVVTKVRLSGSSVRAARVLGDVGGRTPILVDDMISTGATMAAASQALRDAGSKPALAAVATHGLFVGQAAALLGPLTRVLVTDSVDPVQPPRNLQQVSVAPVLAEAVERLVLRGP